MSRASRRKKSRRKAARDKAKNLRRLIAKTENQLVNGDGPDWLRVHQDIIGDIIEAFQGQIAQRLYRSAPLIIGVDPQAGTIQLSDRKGAEAETFVVPIVLGYREP